MNNATFAGRIGRDAEVRHTNDKAVANFSLAVDEYAGKGERKALWIDCSMWGERAEKLAQYLTKGASVAVSGRVGMRTYESNGETRATLTLRVAEVTLLGGKDKDNGQVGSATPPQRQQAKPTSASSTRGEPPADFDDDIPF